MPLNRRSLFFKLLAYFVPLSLAINFLNFYWMDIVFAFVAIVVFCLSEKEWSVIRATFGFENRFFIGCFAVYFASGIVGYFLYSSMQAKEWREISDLRWGLSFFSCYAVGTLVARMYPKFNWRFLLLSLVLAWMIVSHYVVTGGDFLDSKQRFHGFYSNPNYYGMAGVLVWAVLLSFTFYSKDQISRFLVVVALILTTYTLIGTYTRTVWIAMLCVLFVALLYARIRKAAFISAAVLVAVLIAVYFNAFEIKDRILYSFDLSSNSSQGARLAVWSVNWQIFLDHPIFGVGFENSSKLYPQYYLDVLSQTGGYIPGHAHNQFLNILTGSGLVGLFAFLGIFISGLVFFHRKFRASLEIEQKQLSLSSLLCIIAFFACSMTETPIIQQETRNYLLIVLGFSCGYLSVKRFVTNNVGETGLDSTQG